MNILLVVSCVAVILTIGRMMFRREWGSASASVAICALFSYSAYVWDKYGGFFW